MRMRAKAASAALTVAVLVAALVGDASAARMEMSNQAIRVTFPELRFAQELEAGNPEVICPVTLEGSFHSRTIVKSSGSLVGYITRALLFGSLCLQNGGVQAVVFLPNSLPWHIRYESFAGTLPNITRIHLKLIEVAFQLTILGVPCLYRSTTAGPVRGWVERNVGTAFVPTLVTDTTARIPLTPAESFICPASGIIQGSGAIRVLGTSATLIFVRLI